MQGIRGSRSGLNRRLAVVTMCAASALAGPAVTAHAADEDSLTAQNGSLVLDMYDGGPGGLSVLSTIAGAGSACDPDAKIGSATPCYILNDGEEPIGPMPNGCYNETGDTIGFDVYCKAASFSSLTVNMHAGQDLFVNEAPGQWEGVCPQDMTINTNSSDGYITAYDGCVETIVCSPSYEGLINVDETDAYGSCSDDQLNQVDGQYVVGDNPPDHPDVGTVTPSTGSTAGGTAVTIKGVHLGGAAAVTFGGVAAASFSVLSATEIDAVAPAHDPGPADVRVTTAKGQSAAVNGDLFNYQGAQSSSLPAVTEVYPEAGSTAGGDLVTLEGSGFTGATAVAFGGVAAEFQVLSDSTIWVHSPVHAAGTVNVRVTDPAGQSSVVTADKYTYVAPPTPPKVTKVAPASGSTAGGTSVTITGAGFSGGVDVTFGGVDATNVVVKSDTSLTATSPAHAAGVVNVRVAGPTGRSAVVTADHFTYSKTVPTVTKVSPASGSTAGGTAVTITGTGFTAGASVDFGSGHAATSVTYLSATKLTAVSPPHAATSGYVNVTVTTVGGTSASVAADHFAYK